MKKRGGGGGEHSKKKLSGQLQLSYRFVLGSTVLIMQKTHTHHPATTTHYTPPPKKKGGGGGGGAISAEAVRVRNGLLRTAPKLWQDLQVDVCEW